MAVAGGIGVATGASAQVLDEIMVTAQKVEQGVQEVGLSVTAFSGDALRQFGFDDSTDIVAQVPGLNIGTPVGEGNNPSFTLRGVGLNDFNDNNEGPIAVYLDDVYQAALPGLTFQLFDVERVEVLRGPQGTIFGRNATGGLVHFISRKPSEETEAYMTVEAGKSGTLNFEGAVGGALADGVRSRLSVAYDRRDGYVENRIGPDANEADTLALRGQVEFDVGATGLLNLKGFLSRSDTVAPQYQHQATLGATGADNLPFCPKDVPRDIYCFADTDGDNFAGEFDRTGVLDIETTGVHATYETGLTDRIDLVNILAWQKTEKLHEEDTDVGPNPGIEPTFNSDIETFSEELRLVGTYDRGMWQAGVFFLDTKVVGANDLTVRWRGDFAALLDSDPAVFGGALAAFNDFAATPDLLPGIVFDVDYRQDTQSIAGFAQGEYLLTDTLNLTAGLRYTTEDRDFDYVNRAPAGALLNNVVNGVGEANFFSLRPGAVNGFAAALGAGPVDVVSPDASRINDENLTWKLSLDWQATPGTLLYATWSRGFKAGGFNAGFLDQTDFITSEQVAFESELLTSYEAGVKWSSESGLATINASAFLYDYDDFQALTFQGLSQFITNADATFFGGEAELGLRPMDGLDVQLGLSLLDTDVDGVTVQGTTLDNREAVLAPEVTANGFVRYTHAPGDSGELSHILSFNYQGSHFFDITNSDISRQGDYVLFDFRSTWRSDDGRYELSAFVENIFDKEYLVYTFDFTGIGGFNQQFFGPPRWWGVTLGVTY
ncbi:TonB-dependent receptor [Yunchengibacter salinarum]|uniref:TonB-dependent receptor n=1 Tax=Yunchengibacter salinarum TaxID=3133399 RepID=UPI0035B60C43